jgi:hypothetical protein
VEIYSCWVVGRMAVAAAGIDSVDQGHWKTGAIGRASAEAEMAEVVVVAVRARRPRMLSMHSDRSQAACRLRPAAAVVFAAVCTVL